MFEINKILVDQFSNHLPKPGKTGLDWFFFCYFLDKFKCNSVLEVGVGCGGSLFTMLSLSQKVSAVDNWRQGWLQQPVLDNLQKLQKTLHLINQDFHTIDVGKFKKFSFIHLDANKSFDGVYKDLELAIQICDNMICVDDYMNSMWPEVTWAVDAFIDNNRTWKKIMITNHQIFLSQKKCNIKEILVDFPIIQREETVYLTYGNLPSYVDQFISAGKMTYSWHKLAWNNVEKQDL